MFSLFSRKSFEDLSLVFDIQSGIVRAALVAFSKNSKPKILYSTFRTLPFKVEIDGTYLATTMLKALKEVVYQVSTEGLVQVKNLGYPSQHIGCIHYVMSSPWVFSESKTAKMVYEKDTEVTESLVKSMVRNKEEELQSKNKKEKDLATIEQKIFDVRLNGYSIEHYKGKKTKNIEVSFAYTTSSKYILEKIEEVVSKTILCKKKSFHSALLLQYIALRSILGNREEYISVHIHSELTDIVVVKRGVSSYLASFPYGTVSLLRKISEKLKSSEETSSSMLSLYQDGKLEESENRKVEKALESVIGEWQEKCLTSFGYIREQIAVPRLIYLSTHSNFGIFQKALVDTKFEIIKFDYTLVDKLVDFEKDVKKSSLLGMYSISLHNMV